MPWIKRESLERHVVSLEWSCEFVQVSFIFIAAFLPFDASINHLSIFTSHFCALIFPLPKIYLADWRKMIVSVRKIIPKHAFTMWNNKNMLVPSLYQHFSFACTLHCFSCAVPLFAPLFPIKNSKWHSSFSQTKREFRVAFSLSGSTRWWHNMPHDDEMSANIKEIEKLFGTHTRDKRLWRWVLQIFHVFRLLSKAFPSILH